MFFCGCGERGEVYIGGDVLFTGGLVGSRANGVLADGLQCTAMTARELFLARVAVVVDDDESARDRGEELIRILLRNERDFDAFVFFGMDGVAVEEFEFFARWLGPDF